MKGPGGCKTQAGCEPYDKYRPLYNLILAKPGLDHPSDKMAQAYSASQQYTFPTNTAT